MTLKTGHYFGEMPESARDEFSQRGWTHLAGVVQSSFLEHLREKLAAARRKPALDGPGIGGQKWQGIFPLDRDGAQDICAFVSRVTDIPASKLTISQRHFMVYNPTAKTFPKPHKDRYSSAISMGIALEIPELSTLVLYPDGDRRTNPLLTTRYREILSHDDLPEQHKGKWAEVTIQDAPGDAVLFRGSEIWHSRINPAGAAHLYLMFNDQGLDPLGEDPHLEEIRRRSREEANSPIGLPDTAMLNLGSRLDTVGSFIGRSGFVEHTAYVWPDEHVRLSPTERLIIDVCRRGQITLQDMCRNPAVSHEGALDDIRRAVSRLLACGVLEIAL